MIELAIPIELWLPQRFNGKEVLFSNVMTEHGDI